MLTGAPEKMALGSIAVIPVLLSLLSHRGGCCWLPCRLDGAGEEGGYSNRRLMGRGS